MVEDARALEFVRCGAFVRVDHRRVRYVGKAVSGEEHLACPFDVFADRRLAKWMLLPDRSPETRADVVERAPVEPLQRRQRIELAAGGPDGSCGWRGGKPAREIVPRKGASIGPR